MGLLAMTLEEEVAEKMAELLLEAARARELAAAEAQAPADPAALESEVIKWERRLTWWKHLRQKTEPGASGSSGAGG
jgi:hypothetical protein